LDLYPQRMCCWVSILVPRERGTLPGNDRRCGERHRVSILVPRERGTLHTDAGETLVQLDRVSILVPRERGTLLFAFNSFNSQSFQVAWREPNREDWIGIVRDATTASFVARNQALLASAKGPGNFNCLGFAHGVKSPAAH
jgi:hypothetical protein